MTRVARELACGRIRQGGDKSSQHLSRKPSINNCSCLSHATEPSFPALYAVPMLAPRASSAFVCIRCELQHFARPNLTALARRPPRAAAFSTSPRSRDEGDALQPQGDGPRISRVQVSSERPLDRPRRRKGNARLRETTASLGEVKTLGENSEILVLRDMGDDPPVEEDKKPADIVESLPSDAVNIVEALQDQRRPITPEEIVNQLESLRPKTYATPDEPQYVNQTTFIRLARKLMQSFTGQQLSHYYSVTKGVARKNVDKKVLDSLKELQAKADRPAQRSGWHPGTTQIDQRLPSLDVHKRSKRKAISKNLLVDQIMRDVWELVLLEEIESPGEVELQIKPWQLSLLNSGCMLPSVLRSTCANFHSFPVPTGPNWKRSESEDRVPFSTQHCSHHCG
jgi:hypothetical protein